MTIYVYSIMNVQDIVDTFCIHIDKYLHHMNQISNLYDLSEPTIHNGNHFNINSIITKHVFDGWRIMFHVFVHSYIKEQHSLKLSDYFHTSVQQSYLLYLEYISQTRSNDIYDIPSPNRFVYNNIFSSLNIYNGSNVVSNTIRDTTVKSINFNTVKMIVDIVLAWKLAYLSNTDRIKLFSLLKPYVLFFHDDYFEYIDVLNLVQEKWTQYNIHISADFLFEILKEFHRVLCTKKHVCIQNFQLLQMKLLQNDCSLLREYTYLHTKTSVQHFVSMLLLRSSVSMKTIAQNIPSSP
jgi:hypothetical protein